MSVTTFRSFSRVEVLCLLCAAASVCVMVLLESWETVPFHLLWLSVTLFYGFRVWSLSSTVVLVGVVLLLTGAALTRPLIHSGAGLDELVAAPLMAAIFAAMAWQAMRRQAAMAELQQRTQERDFIRDASHQLRTPITVARGHAELILETHPQAPGAQDVQVIAGELDRLSTISDRLIMLAAAEQPGFVAPQPVDVEALVQDTVTRWRPVASRRWQVDVHGDGEVRVDRERIECALDALIENAVNATGDGDLIRVSARVRGSAATIDVTDSGAGIRADDLPHIFERFSRRESNGARRNGGTGLGLPVVKAIAEAHGGSVTVRSERGKGTTFSLRL